MSSNGYRKRTVRVQSHEHGTRRIEIQEQMTTIKFYKKVIHAFHLLNPKEYGVYRGRNKTILIKPSSGKSLAMYKIKNGDMLFMFQIDEEEGTWMDEELAAEILPKGENDEQGIVDDLSGLNIGDDEDDCSLYDFETLTFVPFKKYLEETQGCTLDYQRFRFPANSNPPDVIISQQRYRHVDSIMFENPIIVERFINFWRKTGFQRVGMLYGHYEADSLNEDGRRAVVSTIYEPPQVCGENSIKLSEDGKEKLFSKIAKRLGLTLVGWIFTDIIADKGGEVKSKRSSFSEYLSAEECMMAANYQLKFQNACPQAANGYFGSNFVTICVSGDSSNQIHFEAFQASNQCMAMMKDGVLSSISQNPAVACIKASQSECTPNLYYMGINENSGIEEKVSVSQLIPTKLLVVHVRAEFPAENVYTFPLLDRKPFPIENRIQSGDAQTLEVLSNYLSQFSIEECLQAMSDVHLLLYIAALNEIQDQNYLKDLLTAVKNQDEEGLKLWMNSLEWQYILDLLSNLPSTSDAESQPRVWICNRCKNTNDYSFNKCEVCSIAKNI